MSKSDFSNIKSAYRKLLLQYHPDKAHCIFGEEKANKIFKYIKKAYEIMLVQDEINKELLLEEELKEESVPEEVPSFSVQDLINTGKMPKVTTAKYEPRHMTLNLNLMCITDLEGLNAIDHSDSIEALLFGQNKITKIPKDAFMHFPNLKALEFTSNRITTVEPGAFNGLSKLEQLFMTNNNIPKEDQQRIRREVRKITHGRKVYISF